MPPKPMARSDTGKPTSVVGLGVGPELLADVLERLITRRGLVVTRLPAVEGTACAGAGPQESPGSVDVAVVYGTPGRVAAAVVVCLPDDGRGSLSQPRPSVVVARSDRSDTVEVEDVESLVSLIVELATRH